MASTESLDSSALSGISDAFQPASGFDSSVAFDENLALDDGNIFPADWDQQTPPYEGHLYSTPLSWEPPESKFEFRAPAPYTTMGTLTEAQRDKLRAIAMPQHLQYRGLHSPNSSESAKSHSPDNHLETESRKRKSSAEADDEDDDDSNPPVKKTAHNMIEKRYRTNLNDKIAALRDSVPSLRIMSKSARGEDTADDREDLQGLTPAHKLNKATVLSKATEYINHLEKRNKRLQQENAEQKARLAAFETLFRAGSMGFNPTPPISNPFQYSSDYNTPGPSPIVDTQGMIQVPDDMRRLHGQASQQIYPVPQEFYPDRQQQMAANGWTNPGLYGKLMVGSLAGLMIMEGFSEREQSSESPAGRGLFAVPTQLLRYLGSAFYSNTEFGILGYHVSAINSLWYLKLALIMGVLVYAFLPSLFASRPKPKNSKTAQATITAAPSVASTIQVRRQAWLTAIQTVWVPRHNFFLEAAALCLKMVKLSMRNVIGVQGYAYVTGITQQQEAARIKAWVIALDAQLAGGDVEISKSRLTLTLLASGTLPDTPARLMLKALHVRILLWEVGNAGFNGYYLFQELAAKLARWKWNEAKQLQQLISLTKTPQEDKLPDYLIALLEQDCDDVLIDSIGQRAYNLAWNLPTTHNTYGFSDGMDGVVNDSAIRSPLDAVAAWYSSLVLQRALAKSLENNSDDVTAQKQIVDDILLAIRTAPIGSGPQLRALVARSVLVKEKRGANIAEAMQALGPLDKQRNLLAPSPTFINASTPLAGLPDVQMSLRCAMAIAHLDRYPSPARPEVAIRIIRAIRPTNLTLLGFTAAFKLMEEINSHDVIAATCTNTFEKLAGGLRIWIGGKHGERSGLDKEVKKSIVGRCLVVTKRIVGMEDESGYESMLSDGVDEGC